MKPIQRALISVSDKTGVLEFARELHNFGIEILSTGGTAELCVKVEFRGFRCRIIPVFLR
ncbi:MAG: hypothetical protein CM1200mP16_05570 [Nitrospina sp.]|nr:MAG: hypothetical protein CM1200mP16_05570 [Nitrospina sp.]